MAAAPAARQHSFMVDYQSLRVIWWLFLALLLIGIAVIEGIELGLRTIFPFIGRDEPERQTLLEETRAYWSRNQVLLISGAIATGAAWPLLCEAGWSTRYLVIPLLLFIVIQRPLAFHLRSRLRGRRWRSAWDWGLCIGAAVAAFFLGVAFGNLYLGLPFHIDAMQRIVYTGGLFNLVTPFACLCGACSLTMMVLLGACHAAMKTREPLARRARHAGIGAAGLFVIAFIAAGIGVIFWIEGYRILANSNPLADSNPTLKWVTQSAPGAWLDNYLNWPLLWLAPLSSLLGALFACWLLILRWARAALVASCLVPLGAVLTAGFALFPFLLPSSENPNHSLTVWDASSGAATLRTLLVGVLIVLPALLSYAALGFHVSRDRSAFEVLRDPP